MPGQADVEDDQVGRAVEHRVERDSAVVRAHARRRSPRGVSARASGSAMSRSSSASSTRCHDPILGARSTAS